MRKGAQGESHLHNGDDDELAIPGMSPTPREVDDGNDFERMDVTRPNSNKHSQSIVDNPVDSSLPNFMDAGRLQHNPTKQPYSTVSEAQNTRENFLGPFSSHDDLSNDNHAHFVELNKHHDISLAESSDFVSNLHDHDRSVNLRDTARVRL